MPIAPLRISVAALLLTSLLAAQGDRWFTVSPYDDKLRHIDPYTAQTLSATSITATNRTVVGGNGLAAHPITAELYAVLQLQGVSARWLAKLDPLSAAATLIGALPDKFAGLTFDRAGTLYGVTGEGATTPETLYVIHPLTAQTQLFLTLGNGTEGEAIGFHPPSGLIYHASGLGVRNVDEIFESIHLQTKAVTNVPLSHGDWLEVGAMTHFAGGVMLAVDLATSLWAAHTTGVIDRLGTLDHIAKGIANARATGGAHFLVYGGGCPAPSQSIPMLGGSGIPMASAPVSLRLRNGVPSAAAVLAFGLGTQQASLGPECLLSVLPLSPILLVLPLDPSGSVTLPLVMPSPALPADLYLQAAQVAGNQLSLSNALRLRPM